MRSFSDAAFLLATADGRTVAVTARLILHLDLRPSGDCEARGVAIGSEQGGGQKRPGFRLHLFS